MFMGFFFCAPDPPKDIAPGLAEGIPPLVFEGGRVTVAVAPTKDIPFGALAVLYVEAAVGNS